MMAHTFNPITVEAEAGAPKFKAKFDSSLKKSEKKKKLVLIVSSPLQLIFQAVLWGLVELELTPAYKVLSCLCWG